MGTFIRGGNSYYKVEDKLKKISEALINTKGQEENLGLMSGDSGKALFFLHYAQFTNREKDLQIAVDIIESITAKIDRLFARGTTFSSGITGFGWLLQHVDSLGILDFEPSDFLENLDLALYPIMMSEVKRGNYDYLHGSIGIGLYYLSRAHINNNRSYLCDLIVELHSIAHKSRGTYWWESFDRPSATQKKEINLGLAHGMPSILQFLVATHKAKISVDLTFKMIRGIKENIYSYKNDFTVCGSFFPYRIEAGKDNACHSRLAWCYGDLGICLALFNACECTNDIGMKDEVMKMLYLETQRRDLKKEVIWDANFCHGTSGVAYFFNKIQKLTGDQIFKAAADYWYHQTLTIASFEDGLAGYKTFRGLARPIYENDCGLIEGITGIGLSLLSAINDKSSSWDEAMLLN